MTDYSIGPRSFDEARQRIQHVAERNALYANQVAQDFRDEANRLIDFEMSEEDMEREWDRMSTDARESATEHSLGLTLSYSVQADDCYALGFLPITSGDFYQPINTHQLGIQQPLQDCLQSCGLPITDSDADMDEVDCLKLL
ncbi:hypothetical protein BBP40_003429, partial [Aspergillus hancockii]